MYKNSIALVTCYMGKLPWYFDYFVHSCRFNPTVDFFICTDDTEWTGDLPPNVKVLYVTLKDIGATATRKLGFDVNITSGYKLCDFKPAYGYIFSDFLSEYDFWGHCDIDIIFGCIREFITDELLQIHDLVSVRHDYLTGCFLLYRNIPRLNMLFMHSKDYKKVFTSEKHYCFDETNFAHDAFGEEKQYWEVNTEIESMTHVVKRLEAENYIRPFFDFIIIEGLPGRLRWEDGHLYFRNKFEVLFYHLIYFKTKFFPKNRPASIPGTFLISPTKIYHLSKSKPAVESA